MATNYNILLQSEKNLKSLVSSFLEYTYSSHDKVWKLIFEGESSHKLIDKTEQFVKGGENLEQDLINECIWTISKDAPRANHLRLIIYIIYSSRDISRANAKTLNIIKNYVRKNILKEEVLLIKPLVEKYLKILQKFSEMYNKKLSEKEEQVETISFEFLEFSHKLQKELLKHFEEKDQQMEYFNINMIIKLIESTVDHIKNVFNTGNFISVKKTTL